MATAVPGESEAACSWQEDKAICNRTSAPASNVGDTQGELYSVPRITKAQIWDMLTDLAKMIRLLSVMTRACLKQSSLTFGRAVLVGGVEGQTAVLSARRLLLGRGILPLLARTWILPSLLLQQPLLYCLSLTKTGLLLLYRIARATYLKRTHNCSRIGEVKATGEVGMLRHISEKARRCWWLRAL